MTLNGADTGPHVTYEPSPRRVRVIFADAVVADTTRALLVHERNHVPVYYFPSADVRADLLHPSAHRSHCPYKGDARYWSVQVGDRVAENAVWSYPTPLAEVAGLADFRAFYWNRMDHWYEEDEEVFVHARDPYKRVDVVRSERQVEVIVDGVTVANSRGAHFLFETGLPTRYYLPPADVRTELLKPSGTRTACPYKGTASYFTLEVGGRTHEDLVWVYSEPIPECPKIKGLLCFFNEHVDEIRVAGTVVPKTKTPWSRD